MSSMAKLFVICGHGAGDPGADGGGYTEAERVRALGARIKALGGSEVELGDTSRNWYRDGGINRLETSAPVVELHMDASGVPGAHGAHVIIKSGFAADKYDEALADRLSAMMPGRVERPVRAQGRRIRLRLHWLRGRHLPLHGRHAQRKRRAGPLRLRRGQLPQGPDRRAR